MKKALSSIFAIISLMQFSPSSLAADNNDNKLHQKLENCIIEDFVSSHRNSIENCEFDKLELTANLAGSLKSCKTNILALFKEQTFETGANKILAAAEFAAKLKDVQLNTIEKITAEVQSAVETCKQNGNIDLENVKVKISSKGKITIRKADEE